MCVLFTAHNVFGSLLSFGASTVYTCSTFSVLSKMMVFLSAAVLHRFTQVHEVHSDAMQEVLF